VARAYLQISREGFHQTSKSEISDSLITKNAVTLGSGYYREFWDELLLKTAKELSSDEPQEEKAAKQEDRKAILLR
jgi:hypothetical protein